MKAGFKLTITSPRLWPFDHSWLIFSLILHNIQLEWLSQKKFQMFKLKIENEYYDNFHWKSVNCIFNLSPNVQHHCISEQNSSSWLHLYLNHIAIRYFMYVKHRVNESTSCMYVYWLFQAQWSHSIMISLYYIKAGSSDGVVVTLLAEEKGVRSFAKCYDFRSMTLGNFPNVFRSLWYLQLSSCFQVMIQLKFCEKRRKTPKPNIFICIFIYQFIHFVVIRSPFKTSKIKY